MSIGERLFDDSGFQRPGEKQPEPQYVEILISRIGLDDAQKDRQIDGIRAWLTGHKPSSTLVRSIERQGYGAALLASSERK